jgi:predicted ferric reductase
VVALWWTDTTALHGWPDEWTAAGRLLGLAGTYLLLVQIVLLARVPWLDRVVGMDRLAIWHRRNGEYVVALLSAHAVAIIVGYALADHRSIGWETGTLIRHYPDVLAGFVGLALLLTVGLTSVRVARRHLRYETWHFIHLYAYLAVVLSFAHELATGNDFSTNAAHRWFWVGLHLVVLALVVTYRVVVPLVAFGRHDLRVQKVVPEAPGVVSIWIQGRDLANLGAQPGQFLLWRFLTRATWWQAHPFSLSSIPDRRHLRITVKAVGDHSQWLQHVHRGTRVFAEGPYGGLTAARRTRDKVLFLAGGIGVTPLRALFETIPARTGDLSFIYRASRDEDFALRAELEDIAHRRGARLAFLSGSRYDRGVGAATLRKAVPDLVEHDVYVCGPPGFVDTTIDALRDAGASPGHIHAERFEL